MIPRPLRTLATLTLVLSMTITPSVAADDDDGLEDIVIETAVNLLIQACDLQHFTSECRDAVDSIGDKIACAAMYIVRTTSQSTVNTTNWDRGLVSVIIYSPASPYVGMAQVVTINLHGPPNCSIDNAITTIYNTESR